MTATPFSWDEWAGLDGLGLAARIRSGAVGLHEVASQAVQAVGRVDDRLSGVLEIFEDAITAHRAGPSGGDGALAGVPVLLKDLGAQLSGRRQESGSALFRGHVAYHTDPFVARILCAGLLPLGRTTTAELGLGWDTSTVHTGRVKVTRNPFDPARTAGGSSGGSAAIVAAGAVPIATTSDGGGSTRIPAAHCGLVGLKPTRGLCPRPQDSSEYLSRISTDGVVTRSVRDTAAVLDHTARVDPGGSFMAVPSEAGRYLAALDDPLDQRPVVGVSAGRWGRAQPPSSAMRQRLDAVAAHLEALGCRIVEIADERIVDWDELWESYRINWIASRAQLALAARQRGRSVEDLRELLTPMVHRMFVASSRYDVAALHRMMALNNRVTRAYGCLFERIDLLLTPAYAAEVPIANGPSSTLLDEDVDLWLDRQLDGARYAILCNEVGAPAISLPSGPGLDGLPIGVQLCAPWRGELGLLQLAAEIERSRPEWFSQRPAVHVAGGLAGSRAA